MPAGLRRLPGGGCLAAGVALLAAALLGVPAARALESFDFELPYLVHPGQQVWDFSLVQDDDRYHLFYHTIPQQIAHPSAADTIWHATSPDLKHWQITGPALTVGPDWYDRVAMWAPDVVYDPAGERWAMLYTGVTDNMVQRACLAWSDDLLTWTKSPQNPVFAPDSLLYHWAPKQAWSSFRDPHVYHDGSQWNMLSTAGRRLGGYPGYRRGIVHRAVSPDLVAWTDAGVFFQHDGAVGATRDLESVQYVVRNGWHHLFFVEQDLELDTHPTSHLVAAAPTGWTMSDRAIVDAGWAPEIRRFDPAAGDVFARLAKDQDPRDGSWFVAVRFDTIRYDNGGQTVVVVPADDLAPSWRRVSGPATATFGENGLLRDEAPLGIEGQGWFSSCEHYGGPLSGSGAPGLGLGDAAVMRLESRAFTLSGGHLRLLAAGGYAAGDCYVALLDDFDGTELSRLHVNNPNRLGERLWDMTPWLGRSVRLAIVDNATGPGGWIAVDGIEERTGGLAAVPTGGVGARGSLLAWPNPCNPQAQIRYHLASSGPVRLAVYDVRGRLVADIVDGHRAAGEHVVIWPDGQRRNPGSGVYLVQLTAGRQRESLRLLLVE